MSIDAVFQAFPQLKTGNLVLRRIRPTDAESVFDILADKEVARFYDEEPFSDVSQAVELIEYWATAFERRQVVRWGIACKDDNSIIGSCGYYGLHRRHMKGSLGYELAQPYWRQGIMTQALSAVIEFGFEGVGLNRIEATVMVGNQASIRLLEKLGFRNEGVLREYERWPGKRYVDLLMFSLLRRERRS